MAASKVGSLAISKDAEAILKANPAYENLARANLEEMARRLRLLDELAAESTITEADAVALGRKIRRGAYRRFKAKK